MTDAERCPGCGGLYSLIGTVHRCSGALSRAQVAEPEAKPARPVTEKAVTKIRKAVTKIGRGRPKKEGAMSGAERVRALRARHAKAKAEREAKP